MLKVIKKISFSGLLYIGKVAFYNRKSKVFYYHDVYEDNRHTDMATEMELFKTHIKVIKKAGFTVVNTISQLENQILIAFDDGFRGVYDNRKYFIQEDIKPLIFVITKNIGKPGFLTSNEIIELQQLGFRFQGHTHTHPDLPMLSPAELREEFVISKKLLEGITNSEVTELCFPKGLFSDQVLSIAKKSCYDVLYSSIPGSYQEKNKLGVVPRNLVQSQSKFNLSCILYGGLNVFKRRYMKQHYN